MKEAIYYVRNQVVSVYGEKACGGNEVYLYSFLTSVLGGFEQLASSPGHFNPMEKLWYPLIATLVAYPQPAW